MNLGKLFYLMGASGAGKDSLIGYARQHLDEPNQFKFIRRQITRPPKSSDDNQDYYLSLAAFERRQSEGNFAMSWKRHGICYGIPYKINTWLNEGVHVVINGSRHYYPIVLKTYPELYAIWVTAEPSILEQRLHKRGRESPAKIKERMQSATSFTPCALNPDGKFCIIENNGSLTESGDQFLRILQT